MFSSHVYKWNSVDISNGEEGICSTRGLVVDKTETGLVVDFGIANKKPELIPFHRITQDDERHNSLEYGYGSPVSREVLLQLSADHPWTWYPAELRSISGASFALVKAKVPDGRRIIDLVRSAQIRYCGKQRTTVLFSDYLKEFVSVPYDDFVVTHSFRKLWTGTDYLARTYPVGIVDKKFFYMQKRRDDGLDPSRVVNDITEIMRESTKIIRGLKRSHENGENEDPPHPDLHTKTELVINDIPFDVLHAVLSHLDTVELIRYRRVCPLWDSVITTMDSCKVVIYDISNYENQSMYLLAAVLFKLIKETTMYLVFTRSKKLLETGSGVWFAKSLEVAETILDETGITIPTLVLADLQIDQADMLKQNNGNKPGSAALSDSLRCICERLVLVRVTLLNLSGDNDSVKTSLTSHRFLDITYATISTENASQWELRDALEPSAQQFMKSVPELDKRHLSIWIDWVILNALPKPWQQKSIMQILHRWEGDDPRFGPAVTWKDVEDVQLSKLDKLHSITVVCLLYTMKRFEEDHSDSDQDEDEEEESDDSETDSDDVDSTDHDSNDGSRLISLKKCVDT